MARAVPRESSNAFACGADQNCGNFITNTPTTRVSKPPGGASSLSLAWGGEEEPPPRRTGRAFVPPPGGRGGGGAGYGGAPGTGYEADQPSPASRGGGGGYGASPVAGGYGGGGGGGRGDAGGYGGPPGGGGRGDPTQVFGARPGRPSSNAFATGSQQNCGNVLTDTPTTRVVAPPGGASALSLAWDETAGAGQSPSRVPAGRGAPQPARQGGTPSKAGSAAGYSEVADRGDYEPSLAGSGYYESSHATTTHESYVPHHGSQADGGYQQPARGGAQGAGYVHGSRPQRVSSNVFACGNQQNCGNVLTDTPSTRVSAPPGGATSFSLGWDYGPSAPAQPRRQQQPAPADHDPRGGPSGGAAGGGEARGYRDRDEIEGSRPRQHKSGIRVNAPPGGAGSFSPDWDTETAVRSSGKKLFPGAGGAGSNRDMRAVEEMRYYQAEEERLGKQRAALERPMEARDARDTHRYYLAADDRADRVPGKAQCPPPYGERDEPILCWPEQ